MAVSGAANKAATSIKACASARHGRFLLSGKPALLLFHRDLLGDAGRVLRIGFGHGAVIYGLTVQGTDALADVEDMWCGGLLRSVLRSDPVDNVLAGRVRGILGGI